MKIIFLDNDGVICLSDNWGSRYKKAREYMIKNNISEHAFIDERKRNVLVRFDNFDKKAIKILNKVIEETDAEIVVSSDWKLHANLEELGEYYESQGIIKKPIAITPNLEDFDPDSSGLYHWKGWKEKARILEIEKYLELNTDITHWVAIDDLNMSPEANQGHGLKNFILTPRSNEGIKQSGIKDKLINLLNEKEDQIS
jgi:tetratricopeptide (TPR) repeat protein